MKKHFKKTVAMLLICCLSLCIWSASAFAAGTGEFDPIGNILPDPSFEENENVWNYNDSDTYFGICQAQGNLDPHSGEWAAAVLGGIHAPTCIEQEIFIPETGLYEFSGYFAANCQQITLRIEGTESHSISFPGNNIEWEKQTLLFYANEGDVIRLEISSIQSTALTGYIMDDICLTRCEGTSFDEPTDLSVSGGMAVNEPSMALQGDYCRLLLSGKTLELSGPMLEPGLYTLSFFVKGPDAESAACAFPIDVAMSGEAYAPELVLADQWKNITVSFSVEEASELSATIGMEGLTAVLFDNFSIVRVADLPPKPPLEQLTNLGFENGISGWTQQQGTSSSSILVATSQSYSGTKSLFMGYFSSEPLNNYVSQDSSAGAGQYAFSAHIKTEGALNGVGAFLLLEAKDASGKILASAASPAISNSNGAWVVASTTLSAPAGTKTVTAKIGGLYCTGGFYVDDASLQYSK